MVFIEANLLSTIKKTVIRISHAVVSHFAHQCFSAGQD